MKKSHVFGLALMLSAGVAYSAQFGANAPANQGPAPSAPCTLGEDDITQSNDCAVQTGFGIACTDGFQTSGSYYRRFFLTADHGITEGYTVDAVELAAEVDTAGFDGTNVITVNVYALPIGAALTLANLGSPLDTGSFDIGGNFTGANFTVPMSGTATIDPATDDLVVEYLGPDHLGLGTGGGFFPGANPEGETQPTYLAAEGCGIIDPVTMAEVGFPDSANIMVVEGTEGGGMGGDRQYCILFDNFCDSVNVLNGVATWDYTCDGVTLATAAQTPFTQSAEATICTDASCPNGEDWSFVFRGGQSGTFNLFNLTAGIQFQFDSPYSVLLATQCPFASGPQKRRLSTILGRE